MLSVLRFAGQVALDAGGIVDRQRFGGALQRGLEFLGALRLDLRALGARVPGAAVAQGTDAPVGAGAAPPPRVVARTVLLHVVRTAAPRGLLFGRGVRGFLLVGVNFDLDYFRVFLLT